MPRVSVLEASAKHSRGARRECRRPPEVGGKLFEGGA